MGDLIPVKLLSIDDQGRLRLSRKAALAEMGEKDQKPAEKDQTPIEKK
jgi:predicted RNA-binding protein with RPS1 domain